MIKFIRHLVEKIEDSEVNFWLWIGTFLSIIIGRVLIENWLPNFPDRTLIFMFYEFSHTFLFFLVAYVFFVILLNKTLGISLKKATNVMLWGYLIILTPPLFDHFISGGSGYWSFYKFDSLAGLFLRFLTFFGDKPEIGITYGVRIEVAISLLFLFIYSLTKTHPSKNKLSISLAISFLSYLVFFILGTFPSWITIFIEGLHKGFTAITEIDIAQMFLSPAFLFSREINDLISSLNVKMSIVYSLFLSAIFLFAFFHYERKRFIAVLKNARFPQIIYHVGLFSLGILLAIAFSEKAWRIDFFNTLSFLLVSEAIALTWLASVVANDLADRNIDRVTNASRPLIENKFSAEAYRNMGIVFFLASIFFSAIISFKLSLILIAYQAIAFIYSSPPLRLKRFAFVSTFVSAMASILILFSGFILASSEQNIASIPSSLVWLLVISYTLSLPIKDFKDIEGDKADGVYTIPVIFGEQWGKIIVGSGIFMSFLLSVIVLNEPRLFWLALIFGGISFWLVNNMQHPTIGSRVHYRNIFWWILVTTSVYGIILVKIIFL